MNFELNWLVWIVPTFNWALQGTSEHQNREKPDPQEPPIFRPINCGSRRVLVGALMELLMEILVGLLVKVLIELLVDFLVKFLVGFLMQPLIIRVSDGASDGVD